MGYRIEIKMKSHFMPKTLNVIIIKITKKQKTDELRDNKKGKKKLNHNAITT